MSLEAKIDALTSAVLGLTYAMNQHKETESKKSAPAETALAEPAAKKTKEPVAPSEVPNEKPKTTTDTSPPSEPEFKAVSYDDVKKATNALSAAKGRDVTIAVLSRFGVKKATELDAAQWADYIEHAAEVTEGADV